MRERMTEYISSLQMDIVSSLEKLDPSAPSFRCDSWDRAEGGSGRSYTFSAPSRPDSILEKAGVNISMIYGTLPPTAVKQMATQHSSMSYNSTMPHALPFFAGGVSLVIQPRNPLAPIVHANYRYFEITETADHHEESKVLAWWFGGVTDLTPCYLFEEDVVHFHTTLKATCDKHGPGLYPAFKKSCDDYFFIKHREEHRGVGGVRFDDLCDEPHALLSNDGTQRPNTAEEIFLFVQDCGNSFLPSYMPILQRRHGMGPVTDRMRRWQLIRRGRNVEFNLLYERGTKFGLATPGVRVENVLMGMPEVARWEYMCELGRDDDGSEESKMVLVLKNPREWV
ncbi:hypothetical protein AMATHDRAFT_136802 [Amanita thiersii Skay4041]|uniref:coproporphyrinogen oxidase n=1 Tax=Amanita thiersii Skay4041 TaxID=703135 RepID=A0A2A9NUA6_9AGAR|nr:hypothetical protein AMATHDRAFT_136802 [Amanita thiersii Skay4041]